MDNENGADGRVGEMSVDMKTEKWLHFYCDDNGDNNDIND
jgi:hypothetical protein